MTITFENVNDAIVYALERVISYTRTSQQILVAQCVWWLAGIIGLEESVVIHIDKLLGCTVVGRERKGKEVSNPVTENTPEIHGLEVQESKEECQDKILTECEEYLKDSRRLREIAALKATRKTLTGLINPTPISKNQQWKKDRNQRIRPLKKEVKKEVKTAGISETEIRRRKEVGECLRCAWPADRKGAHSDKTCIRPIRLAEGTASYPKGKTYEQADQLEQASVPGTSSSTEEQTE